MMDKSVMKKSAIQQPQLRFLAQSARLEEEINPRLIRLTSGAIALCIGAFIVWASLTNVNEIARTPGEIIPAGMQKVVQHLEGGIIKDINVKDGDVVKAGQTLLVLEETGVQEDLNRALTHGTYLAAQKELLQAFVDGRDPDFSKLGDVPPEMITEQQNVFKSTAESRLKERKILQDQVAQKEQSIKSLQARQAAIGQNLKLAQDMYDRRQGLYRNGYISHISFLQTEQELNTLKGERSQVNSQIEEAKATLQEYQGRLQSLEARNRDDAYQRLNALENEIKQNAEVTDRLQNRRNRLEVTAPVDGLVKGLSVNTIGAVVGPGQSLMEIVPVNDDLLVEIRIPPQYAGHLTLGQDVQVKVSSYDFSRYGAVPGKLTYLSPTTFVGERGERFYRGHVALDRNFVGGKGQESNKIIPGMTVMADIVTGRKTVMQYLMKPIHTSLMTAFSER